VGAMRLATLGARILHWRGIDDSHWRPRPRKGGRRGRLADDLPTTSRPRVQLCARSIRKDEEAGAREMHHDLPDPLVDAADCDVLR
jgi:hypothetical protein